MVRPVPGPVPGIVDVFPEISLVLQADKLTTLHSIWASAPLASTGEAGNSAPLRELDRKLKRRPSESCSAKPKHLLPTALQQRERGFEPIE
ncbi:MAG: hypothetical protein DMG67_11765 [Acidobacteria bacterium]|nr:MAG: hypothetical protein DMG67_11765 [Acidobacteriota bacterium]